MQINLRSTMLRCIGFLGVLALAIFLLNELFPQPKSHVTKGGVGRVQIRGLELMASEYQAEIGSLPPTEGKDFSDALRGANKLKKEYIILDNWPHDQSGRLLDPWGQPYWTEVIGDKIKVHSITLDRDPSTF